MDTLTNLHDLPHHDRRPRESPVKVVEALNAAQLAQLAHAGIRAQFFGEIMARLAGVSHYAELENKRGWAPRQIVAYALELSQLGVESLEADEMRRAAEKEKGVRS